MMNKPNDMMFRVFIRLIVIVVVTFSLYMFFSGHHEPRGGFIGGLMTAIAILMLYVVFGLQTIKKALPFNYPYFMGIGLLLAASTCIISMIAGDQYLKQYFGYFHIPIFGEVQWTRALIFDVAVSLVVVGTAMSLIWTVVEDDS